MPIDFRLTSESVTTGFKSMPHISILYFLGFIIASMKLKEIFDISKESLMEIFYIAPAVQRISEIKAAKKQEGLNTALSDFSIDFQDVSFSYNEDRTILKDVSMSVKEGELFALVGPSGCGKTTILRLLSRLYDAKSGKIFIGGKDLQNTATDSIFQKISNEHLQHAVGDDIAADHVHRAQHCS